MKQSFSFCLLIFLLFISQINSSLRAQAPNFNWAKQGDGNFKITPEEGRVITIDNAGNSFASGIFQGQIVFGNTTLTSLGGIDLYLVKYDPNGNILWAKSYGGADNDYSQGIVLDAAGNIYLTGYFSGNAIFGNVNLINYGALDMFIAKFDNLGNVTWAKSAGGTFSDVGFDLTLDPIGNIYITGYSGGIATFSNLYLFSNGNNDIFIAKYDSLGNVVWVRSAGGNSLNEGRSIKADASGNTYLTGAFSGTALFDNTSLSSSGGTDIFIAKYNTSGYLVWVKKAGGTANDQGNGIVIDGSGSMCITGTFETSATFETTSFTSSGLGDIFIAKYDTGGNLLWATKAGGGGNDVSSAIGLDATSNCYITGYVGAVATFGNLASTNQSGIYVAKCSNQGIFNWVNLATSGGQNSYSIAVNASGDTHITGYFYGIGTFNNTTLNSSGDRDIFTAKISNAGNIIWAKQPSVIGQASDFASKIALDSFGNSYILGVYTGTASFGGVPLTSSGMNDIFLVKYGPTGNVIWAKSAGALTNDFAGGVATDPAGNVYIIGHFGGAITFGNTTITSNGSSDLFIVKYDPSGNVIWAKGAGGTASDNATGIAIDNNGNAIITGHFLGSTTFGTTTFSSGTQSDIFIAKINASGNFIWAFRAGSPNSTERSTGVAVDGSGNIFLSGNFRGITTLGNTNLYGHGNSETDIFIAKYNSAGSGVWAKEAGSSSSESGNAVAVDASGNSYLTGYFNGMLSFNQSNYLNSQGGSDIFAAKFGPTGNVIWTKSSGGASDDSGNAIAIDNLGNCYVTGVFSGNNVNFGSFSLSSSGGNDIFITKYNAAGNETWVQKAGGVAHDYSQGISVDVAGNSYLMGTFTGTINFGGIILSKPGNEAFIAKLNSSPTGVPKHEKDLTLSLFPNPSSGDFSITLPIASGEIYNLEISSLDGKKVAKKLLLGKGEQCQKIDLKHLPKGVYLLKLSNENYSAIRKVIIE